MLHTALNELPTYFKSVVKLEFLHDYAFKDIIK